MSGVHEFFASRKAHRTQNLESRPSGAVRTSQTPYLKRTSQAPLLGSAALRLVSLGSTAFRLVSRLRLVLTFFLPCDRLAVTRERGDLLSFHSNAHSLRDFQDHHLVIQFRDSADQPAGCHHLVVALEGFEHLLMRAGFLGLGTNHKEIDDADNQHHRYSRKRDYLVKHSLRASAPRIRLRPRDAFKPHLFSTRSKPLRRRLAHPSHS